MSTKIYTISNNNSERNYEPRFINPAVMSEGELRLLLLLQRIELQQAYQTTLDLEVSRGMVLDAFSKDVHRHIPSFRSLNKNTTPIAKAIIGAKQLVGMANGANVVRNKMTAIRGFDPNGQLINEKDCSEFTQEIIEYDPYGAGPETVLQPLPGWSDCFNYNQAIQVLNKFIPGAAPHALYNYAPNLNNQPAAVGVKAQDHRLAIAAMAQIHSISFQSMESWFDNGIRIANYQSGIEPLGPEKTFNALLQKAVDEARIGFDPLTIIAVISAIVVAAKKTVELVKSLKADKQQQLKAQLPGLGTTQFGPEWQRDFIGLTELPNGGASNGSENGGGDEGDSKLLLGLGVLGALAYATS